MLKIFQPIQKKKKQEIFISNTQSKSMFYSHSPLIMQYKTAGKLNQSDLSKSFKQAGKYGHSLGKKQYDNVADTTENTTAVQSKNGLNKPIQCALPNIPVTEEGSLMREIAQINPNLLLPLLPTTPPQQVSQTPNLNNQLPTPPQQVSQTPNLNNQLPTLPPQILPSNGSNRNVEKNIGKGAKIADFGSGISNTFADTAKYVNDHVSGGMGGVLKLGSVATDAHETYTSVKEGNKVNAGASGIKFLAGGAESGANIAKFAGNAVNSAALGYTGGIAGTLSGLVDTSKGAYNIYKATNGYKNIKNVARGTAEKIEPSLSGSKPRNTEKLAQVQQTIPQKVQDKQNELGDINTQIKEKRQQLRKATQQGDKDNLQQEIQRLKQSKGPLWRERNELQKQGDILQVAQYGANAQSKTKKREAINTASGVGQMVGGSLAIAGVPAAGIGAVPGAATAMAAASIKPAAWLARKGKQFGRDKGLPGFDQEKTSDKKNDERAEIADKLAARRKDPQMQTIFENLPGVGQEQVDSFKDNQMSQNEIMNILKRRHY